MTDKTVDMTKRHKMWLNAAKYRDELKSLQAWLGLEKAIREELANILLAIGDMRRVPAKTIWLREGTPSRNIGYVLLSGSARISRMEQGELECKAPRLLGEMLQFNPAHLRTATVQAFERCVVVQFSWDRFWEEVANRFSDQDQNEIRKAVERYAWKHFAEFPD